MRIFRHKQIALVFYFQKPAATTAGFFVDMTVGFYLIPAYSPQLIQNFTTNS